MTKAEQKKFVRDLSRDVTKSVVENAGRWPAEWDGHELRALLATAFVYENRGGRCGLDPSCLTPSGASGFTISKRERAEKRRATRALQIVCASENLP